MAYTCNADLPRGLPVIRPTVDPTLATEPPAGLDLHEKARVSAAAAKAKRDYPGPVGEVLHRELEAYAQFGWRTEQSGLMPRLVAEVMKPETPKSCDCGCGWRTGPPPPNMHTIARPASPYSHGPAQWKPI